jgi:hypothetical protein
MDQARKKKRKGTEKIEGGYKTAGIWKTPASSNFANGGSRQKARGRKGSCVPRIFSPFTGWTKVIFAERKKTRNDPGTTTNALLSRAYDNNIIPSRERDRRQSTLAGKRRQGPRRRN